MSTRRTFLKQAAALPFVPSVAFGVGPYSENMPDMLLTYLARKTNALAAEWNEKRYHQPADQYHDDWDVSGMVEYARFGLVIATEVANSPNMPTWRVGDEFLPAR